MPHTLLYNSILHLVTFIVKGFIFYSEMHHVTVWKILKFPLQQCNPVMPDEHACRCTDHRTDDDI